MRVAYLTSRFPHLPETFICNEIAEVERQGVDVDLYAYVHQDEPVVHPVARALEQRAVFARPARVALDQLYWLRRAPLHYLSTVAIAIVGNVRSPKFLARALMAVPMAVSFARAIDQSEASHVHAHWATHSGLGAWVIGRLTGLPYSITAHAHDLWVDQTMLRPKLADAAAVVTISENNRRFIADRYGDEMAAGVEVIRCGVDTRRLVPSDATESETGFEVDGGFEVTGEREAGPIRLLTVASLEERKGHTVVLDACCRLADRGVDVQATFIGEGEHRPVIEAVRGRLQLEDVVELAGARDSDGVRKALGQADVFVLASITLANGKGEGIPVALMEAMASGLPVVSTDQAGIAELVIDGETGLLVPEGDAAALADAIARLADDPELRQRLASAGRSFVERHHDMTTNVARLIEVFGS